MMSFGYRPELSEGAIKCPVFMTSTYVFRSAQEGKAFFELAYGLREPAAGEEPGLIYSRVNHPALDIFEQRLALWEGAEACAAFESGMAAITTTMLELLRPGDVLLHSEQLYGGTDHFIRHVLPRYGIRPVAFPTNATQETLEQLLEVSAANETVALIYIETPANPTNSLVDIRACADVAASLTRRRSDGRQVLVAVDNTFLGPLWQHPLAHGADLVLYSATKYIGGHSDLIAGACLGRQELLSRIKAMRTFLGTRASPWTCALLLRSLETLKLRMDQQLATATHIANFLATHTKVMRLYYPGRGDMSAHDARVYAQQCLAPGAMMAFEVEGGEDGAFAVLDALRLIKLAVSLGGTESLAEHPATMTHADVPVEVKTRLGITGGLIRLSVGVEHADDIMADLDQALRR
jgi:methionine-gamma-lyase